MARKALQCAYEINLMYKEEYLKTLKQPGMVLSAKYVLSLESSEKVVVNILPEVG